MTPDQFARISSTYGPWFATTVVLGGAVVFLGKIIINDIKKAIEDIATASMKNTDAIERLALLFEERLPKRSDR